MVRVLVSTVLCSVTAEEVSSLLQTRANNDADCTRKNKCTTTTTTPEETCAEFQCPMGMKQLQPAGTCSSGGCTQHDCCEEHTCEDFYKATECPTDMNRVDPLQACRGQCSEQQCCKEKPTCAKYSCPADMTKINSMKICAGRCTPKQCCEATTTTTTPLTCEDFVCPRFMTRVDTMKVCKGGVCTPTQCCEKQQETCADYQCPSDMEDGEKSVVCAGKCTSRQCCKMTTTTTTTTTPSTRRVTVRPPPKYKNCPIPPTPQVCHFWGEPHFTKVFGTGASGWDKDAHRAGRMAEVDHRALEFHEAGLWRIAKANGHEVQAFFCEGPDIDFKGIHYDPTSSACAIAIRMSDGTKIVIMRNRKTKGGRGTWSSNMRKGDADIVEIFVNGVKKSWYELSPNGKTSGQAVAFDVPANAGSADPPIGTNTYISQLSSKSKREGSVATAPVCVGDLEKNFLVDVSVSVVSGDWPMVYEMSVTVLATKPDREGICGDKSMRDKVDHPRVGGAGYLGGAADSYRVKASESIFSSVELKQLYETCDMDGMTNHLKPSMHNKQKVVNYCSSKGTGGVRKAQMECAQHFNTGDPWLTTCMIEYCANGDRALALMDAEKDFETSLP